MPDAALEHPATEYAAKVAGGEILAGRLVILAAERHLRDLRLAGERGLYFDTAEADRAIDWYRWLNHTKGKWAGQPIVLEPWQQFCTGSVFGWLRKADGLRRFREAYEEVCRKNGKSTRAAGTALYLLIADGEPGPEVYSAATKRDQAKIVFNDAKAMVKASAPLRRRVKLYLNSIVLPDGGKFVPLGSATDTLDGLNVSGAVIDELHAHKDRRAYDVIDTATGSRAQPLMYVITTAPSEPESICYEVYEYCVQVLEGVITDDELFAFIAMIDKGDDWSDPACWPKANPNLGISTTVEDLERKARKARARPAAQAAFRRKHCGEKVEGGDKMFEVGVWDACGAAYDAESLQGRDCFAGLDLSTRLDIAAFVLLFPPTERNGLWPLLCWFFYPADNIAEATKRDRAPYHAWVEAGHIIATPGNVIDYGVIVDTIVAAGADYSIQEFGIDPWNAANVETELQAEGFEVRMMRQGTITMGGPTKDFEALVVSGRLRHFGNPVLRWMADNVKLRADRNDNRMPDKKASRKRIDGIVAAVMAKGRADAHKDEYMHVPDQLMML